MCLSFSLSLSVCFTFLFCLFVFHSNIQPAPKVSHSRTSLYSISQFLTLSLLLSTSLFLVLSLCLTLSLLAFSIFLSCLYVSHSHFYSQQVLYSHLWHTPSLSLSACSLFLCCLSVYPPHPALHSHVICVPDTILLGLLFILSLCFCVSKTQWFHKIIHLN